MIKNKLFLLIFLIFTNSFLKAQPSIVLEDIVARIVKPYLEDDNTKQLQVGIIERGYTYHYTFVGDNASNIQTSDSTTLFGIGSVTKTFTTALLAAMIADKVVKLTDPITNYLPDSITTANLHLQKITIEQLATHTSGFPKTPRNLPLKMRDKNNPYAHYELQDTYDFLMSYKPVMNKRQAKASKKGKKVFSYSHFGMGLLAHLLENAAEKTYSKLLQQYVFNPIGLKDTGMSDDIEPSETILEGHDFSGNTLPLQHFASLGGSEGLYASLRDLVKFTQANMKPIADYYFLNECFNVEKETDDKKVYTGLGWFIIERGKQHPRIYTHSGKSGGFSVYVAFVEATQTAVVVLSNSTKRVDEYGISILELINR